MQQRRILVVAAAVVAALGVALVLLYAHGADRRAEDRFATVRVLTATGRIEAGETLQQASSHGQVALTPVTRNVVMRGAQTSLAGLAGEVALTTIYPGEQIIAAKFGASVAPSSALAIPTGMLAISVNLTDPARVAGFVEPGSAVAVFVNGSAGGQPYTRLLLPKVTVLGVGSTTPATTTGDGSAAGVGAGTAAGTAADTVGGQQSAEQLPSTLLTLAVDQSQAQRILFAQTNGQLALGLLGTSSKVAPAPATTLDGLFR